MSRQLLIASSQVECITCVGAGCYNRMGVGTEVSIKFNQKWKKKVKALYNICTNQSAFTEDRYGAVSKGRRDSSRQFSPECIRVCLFVVLPDEMFELDISFLVNTAGSCITRNTAQSQSLPPDVFAARSPSLCLVLSSSRGQPAGYFARYNAADIVCVEGICWRCSAD